MNWKMRLDEGKIGIEYRIVEVSKGKECKEDCPVCLRLRMLEFGLLKGEKVLIERGGNPMVVKIGDWKMGMRKEEAQRVIIAETKNNSA